MKVPSGKDLSTLAVALAALAALAAVRVAASGELVAAGKRANGPGTASAGGSLGAAGAAESSGDVTAAIAHYRAAVEARPQLVDRRSPEFLGPGFEEKVKGWVSGLRSGRIRGGASALPDASFLFRRMYGGCG